MYFRRGFAWGRNVSMVSRGKHRRREAERLRLTDVLYLAGVYITWHYEILISCSALLHDVLFSSHNASVM